VLHLGRLLEIGEPRELYLRPRSPFVATFLGAANLLVGESSGRSVRLGDVDLPVSSELVAGERPRRVQVLFRPEDVHLSGPESTGLASEELRSQTLGRGVVIERSFAGSTERLRLRLPKLPRVRAVAPPPPFGGDHILVDAVRPQHEAARWPLAEGAEAAVSVRRFHVLAPAALRLVVDGGTTPLAQAARDLGEMLSERMSAHLGRLPGAADALGSIDQDDLGAETERGPEGFDVAVLGLDLSRPVSKLPWLTQARHHVLLVPGEATLPKRILVSVQVGEPGKADVRFAERFAWQLGASATVMTVVPQRHGEVPGHTQRFIESCERMLGARGVVTRSKVRNGPTVEEILAEMSAGEHDLLIIGAPLPETGANLLTGALGALFKQAPKWPILIVRHQTGN
jgi:sulfate/thiosulfate transport system ATP-binding protein